MPEEGARGKEVNSVYLAKDENLDLVEEDLVAFVHRVAANEKATPAEIAALPEVARVLFDQFPK